MNETLETVLQWGVPAAVVFGVTALVVWGITWGVRRSRSGPRARAAADDERSRAGIALVELDDAVAELELEVGLSGALYDGTAPPTLRRARMSAQHARDAAFEQLRELAPDAHPDLVMRVSRGIRRRAEAASTGIAHARAEHAEWMAAHRSAATQIADARRRAAEIRADMGDPAALVADLAARFDPEEVAEARRAAADAAEALAEADALLAEAERLAADPTRSALASVAAAERALRTAQNAARTLEEQHRLVTDAARAVSDEIAAARTALRQAEALRKDLEPGDAERLGGEVRELLVRLDAWEPDAARRPAATVAEVARVRDRLDLAFGDARTAQQRLRGARTALPGTLAAARAAVGRAETATAHAGADARVRLSAAQHELAAARSAHDPVAALDAARRALQHAEDAIALADYDRLTGR